MKPRPILGWTVVALATYAAVFVLPYRFPLQEPVVSETWDAGANNQVAALAVAILSVIVTLVCWYRTTAACEREETGQLPRGYLVAGIAAVLLWTAALGAAVARAHVYWGDQGYFLNQLRSGILFHQHIYTQFEFAYGPMLYLWPAVCIRVLTPLGFSFDAAYLVSLAAMQAAGIALLFYTVQALPMRQSIKVVAFVVITLRTLNSLLGLNYSVFRFILPFAAIVFLSRQRSLRKAALVAGLGEVVCFATSPEIGLAFGAASLAYACYQAWREASRWLLVAAASLAGAAATAAIIGPAYFYTLGHMAKGGFNLLLLPAPHVIALLLALVVFAPLAIAYALRTSSNASVMLAFYAASLGLIPAALGRCDPIHAFFDGIGLYLLSLVAFNQFSPRGRRGWLIVAALAFAFTQSRGFSLYREQSRLLRTNTAQRDGDFEIAALRRIIGNASLSAPLLAPQYVIDDFTRTGQYVPGYFCGWVGIWDNDTEARKIDDMRRTPFTLISMTDPVGPEPDRDRKIALAMRLGFANRPPRLQHYRLLQLGPELHAHWSLRGRFGDYLLFERRE